MGGGTNSSLGTSVGLAPQSCINFTGSYLSNDKVFNFTWEDVGCDFWGGVILVIKKGSIAETFNDGDIIIDTFEKKINIKRRHDLLILIVLESIIVHYFHLAVHG